MYYLLSALCSVRSSLFNLVQTFSESVKKEEDEAKKLKKWTGEDYFYSVFNYQTALSLLSCAPLSFVGVGTH
jgi:hypothetical protein